MLNGSGRAATPPQPAGGTGTQQGRGRGRGQQARVQRVRQVQAQQAPGRGNALMYYRSEGQATAAGGLRSPFPENQPQVANVDSL